MQEDNSRLNRLTVRLLDSSTMTWAVMQEGKRIYEGPMQSCEDFLDWHENQSTQNTIQETRS